jgi:hypothetical protein
MNQRLHYQHPDVMGATPSHASTRIGSMLSFAGQAGYVNRQRFQRGYDVLSRIGDYRTLEIEALEFEYCYEMDWHKRILVWQAEHPTITWIFWIAVWAIVLTILVWPRKAS